MEYQKSAKLIMIPHSKEEKLPNFARLQGILHHKITPLHPAVPAVNGEVKRFVARLSRNSSPLLLQNAITGSQHCPLSCMHTDQHHTTGRSTYSQLFGRREMQDKISLLAPTSENLGVTDRCENKTKDETLCRQQTQYQDVPEDNMVLMHQEKTSSESPSKLVLTP